MGHGSNFTMTVGRYPKDSRDRLESPIVGGGENLVGFARRRVHPPKRSTENLRYTLVDAPIHSEIHRFRHFDCLRSPQREREELSIRVDAESAGTRQTTTR